MNDDVKQAQQDFVAELRSKLEDWQADFKRLKGRADKMLKDKQEDFEGKLEKLESRHETDAAELRQMNEQVWSDLSTGLAQALQALQDALEKADSHLE